ncbi:MAG: hypothetical protein A2Y76_15645 [Planctomycetes bacterium RBG_13_60_9]|nr:MAG: hypothetical protein A2Y76_15645 [Planctomycetes bacterium RBG_13_60_9]
MTHVASTIWFVICVGYLLILTLHQLRFHWWLIFSLSGQSVIVIFVLISLYLFALFRGVGGAQHIPVEHPFTSTRSYMGFYVAAPLLGGLAGVAGMIGENIHQFTLGVALGTLGTTFCVWVILDPAASLIETLLPTSRQHRTARLARAEAERALLREKRDGLLAEAVAREEQEYERWRQILQPQAERLAALLTGDTADSTLAEQEAADIGARAWQLGGLSCMRQLRDMTVAIVNDRKDRTDTDYVSCWWDGIGDWRRPSLE